MVFSIFCLCFLICFVTFCQQVIHIQIYKSKISKTVNIKISNLRATRGARWGISEWEFENFEWMGIFDFFVVFLNCVFHKFLNFLKCAIFIQIILCYCNNLNLFFFFRFHNNISFLPISVCVVCSKFLQQSSITNLFCFSIVFNFFSVTLST